MNEAKLLAAISLSLMLGIFLFWFTTKASFELHCKDVDGHVVLTDTSKLCLDRNNQSVHW